MLLPMNTSNELLQYKRMKLSVQDFRIAHEKALISNAMVFVTSTNRIGKFTRAVVNYFSRKEETPPLFEAPLNLSPAKQKNSTIKLIQSWNSKIKEYNIVMQRKTTTNFNKFCSEDASRLKLLSTPGPPPT
jgi:hypothetical protein